jgi:hypothetical protein
VCQTYRLDASTNDTQSDLQQVFSSFRDYYVFLDLDRCDCLLQHPSPSSGGHETLFGGHEKYTHRPVTISPGR